jgi:hypothetical protein
MASSVSSIMSLRSASNFSTKISLDFPGAVDLPLLDDFFAHGIENVVDLSIETGVEFGPKAPLDLFTQLFFLTQCLPSSGRALSR